MRFRDPLRRWLHLLRTQLADLPPAPSDDDEARYRREAAALDLRHGRLFFAALAAGNVLWWLTDPIVFSREAGVLRHFNAYRPWVTVGAIACWALLCWVPAFARRPVATVAGAGALLLTFVAYIFAGLGGPSAPYFHFLHLTAPASVAAHVAPPTRAAAVLAVFTAVMVGSFAGHPDYRADPLAAAAVSYHLFAHVAAFVAGVVSERARRAHAFDRYALAVRTEELRVLNDELEDRVAAKTCELRTLAARLENAREEERARVARDLHDELGQELAALRFAVGLARRRYDRGGGSIRTNLEELEGLLDRTERSTRDVVLSLRPRVIDDLGLAAAVEWYLGRVRARTGLALDVTLACDESLLSPPVRIAAFRIVQESLTNVERHARAERVRVRLDTDGTALRIEVHDDGVGLGGRDPRRGSGLVGMRERATSLGGRFQVDSPPGGGTRVRVTLPAEAIVEELAS